MFAFPTQTCREFAITRVSRAAMATTFEVLLPFGTWDALPAGEAVLDAIDRLEDQMTVYRESSEVSQLNLRAGLQPVAVETQLFELFHRCAALTRETDGAFDIATGALIKAWGFYRRQGRVPTVAERVEALERTGMRHVIFDPGQRTVRYRKPGLEINLGAVGKGYALDQVGEKLCRAWGRGDALLHGGQSSVLALGSPPGGEGWRVTLRHPWTEEVLGEFQLRDRGLGTSAATFQYFEYNNRKLGHLLDPRIGWPAEGTALVSVVAPTAERADALSTAFFVAGEPAARRYCQAHSEVGVVLLPEGERAGLTLLNLTPDEFRPAR